MVYSVFLIMGYGKMKVERALNVLFCFSETHLFDNSSSMFHQENQSVKIFFNSRIYNLTI